MRARVRVRVPHLRRLPGGLSALVRNLHMDPRAHLVRVRRMARVRARARGRGRARASVRVRARARDRVRATRPPGSGEAYG